MTVTHSTYLNLQRELWMSPSCWGTQHIGVHNQLKKYKYHTHKLLTMLLLLFLSRVVSCIFLGRWGPWFDSLLMKYNHVCHQVPPNTSFSVPWSFDFGVLNLVAHILYCLLYWFSGFLTGGGWFESLHGCVFMWFCDGLEKKWKNYIPCKMVCLPWDVGGLKCFGTQLWKAT